MGKPKPASQWVESGTSPVPALMNLKNVASNTAKDATIAEDAAIWRIVAHENVQLLEC
jgi:hypothetical protein